MRRTLQSISPVYIRRDDVKKILSYELLQGTAFASRATPSGGDTQSCTSCDCEFSLSVCLHVSGVSVLLYASAAKKASGSKLDFLVYG